MLIAFHISTVALDLLGLYKFITMQCTLPFCFIDLTVLFRNTVWFTWLVLCFYCIVYLCIVFYSYTLFFYCNVVVLSVHNECLVDKDDKMSRLAWSRGDIRPTNKVRHSAVRHRSKKQFDV